MIRLAILFIFIAGIGMSQDRRPSHCIAVAENTPGITYVKKAAYEDSVPDGSVLIHYIAHASFLIIADDGTSAITDYTGFIGNTDFVPDAVTMNHAHETHWTAFPDPAIQHVLHGWGENFGEEAWHYLDLGGMVIRNIPTDIRSRFFTETEPNGNSIFVFETAGLCIGHLGHLHHEPTSEQYAALGRVDVVMAAVDGGMTLDLPTMMRVIRRLRSSVVIPMHWFGDGTLDRFLFGMTEDFAVVRENESHIVLSLETLPARPSIILLRPSWLQE